MKAPLIVVGAWFVLDQLFTVVAGHEGLLAPFGPVHLSTAVLGLVVIGLRLVVTFLVLPWAAWRVGRPWARQDDSVC
jgi:hypothetical protein